MMKKIILTLFVALLWQYSPAQLLTPWAKDVNAQHPLNEYPRPQLQRNSWENLNGRWDYAITSSEKHPEKWDGKILVPFPLESHLSGVKKALAADQFLWYRRSIACSVATGKRLWLNFGAVDQEATIYINSKEVGTHKGGYTAFGFDITPYVTDGKNELKLRVVDKTDKGIYPHGKQVNNPANIYYTPSSGIWQTVWLETISEKHISGLAIAPDVDQSSLSLTIYTNAREAKGCQVEILDGNKVVASFQDQRTNVNLSLPVAGLKLWAPAAPKLYNLRIKMGEDMVQSYFAMRKISVQKDQKGIDRIMLNNQPYFNLGTLDQGFWPDGLYTAPTDEALQFDIKAIKAMGFNTIRKHIKVEPARWYYHADRLGMLVWQDMVNPHQGLPNGAKEAFEKQSEEIIAQLKNYPSIVAWVLFNEKWGSYDQERLTKWIKSTDPTRLVNGHSGEILYVNEKLRSPSPNAYVAADMTDIHAYPNPMMPQRQVGKAMVVGEFGGIGSFVAGHQWNSSTAWGYIQEKPAALMTKYSLMNLDLKMMMDRGLSASIYTQPFDVEGEQNGLMTYDRRIIKIPFKRLREIHSPLNPQIGTIPEVEAKEADLTDPAMSYERALADYTKGKGKLSAKELAHMAKQNGDQTAVRLLSEDYMAKLQGNYSQEDLRFIYQVTEGVNDPGFKIIYEQRMALNDIIGERKGENKVMNLLYKDLMDGWINKQGGPDWQQAKAAVAPYGEAGEEIYLRAQAIHYLNKRDWAAYRPIAKTYLARYGKFLGSAEYQSLEDAMLN